MSLFLLGRGGRWEEELLPVGLPTIPCGGVLGRPAVPQRALVFHLSWLQTWVPGRAWWKPDAGCSEVCLLMSWGSCLFWALGEAGWGSTVHTASAATAWPPQPGPVLGWPRRAVLAQEQTSGSPPGFPLPGGLSDVGLAAWFLWSSWTTVPVWVVGWLLCS